MSVTAEVGAGIRSFLVTLTVGEKKCLVVLVSRDGTINRQGDGSQEADSALYIGSGSPGLFESLNRRFDPKWLEAAGKRIELQPQRGAPCLLRIVADVNGSAKVIECSYGADSEGPPQDLAQFVVGAVQITDPWYAEQRAAAVESKRPWWRIW